MTLPRTFYDEVDAEVKFIQSQNPDFIITEYSTYSLNRTTISIIRVIDALSKEVHVVLKYQIKDNWKEKVLKAIELLRAEPLQQNEASFIKLKSESLLNSKWKYARGKTLKELQIMVARGVVSDKSLFGNKEYFLDELRMLQRIANHD